VLESSNPLDDDPSVFMLDGGRLPTAHGLRLRHVSRVVLLDPLSRILLFETKLPYTHVWMTPGGGLKPGESHIEAARRELWEEVGVRDCEIGPCVWTVEFRFQHSSGLIDQRERYFVVRLGSDEVDDANREVLERSEILQHRWWRCEEIQAARGDFRPRELATLLPPIVTGEYPATPRSASVEKVAVVV
jgi:8-oxo-dGTP pyrophosphatase MutT (NUDIX family)